MAPYPCPACGFLVFAEPPGSYDICPVCNWEDDPVQLTAPGYAGGANSLSLYEYQQQIALPRAPLSLDRWQQYARAVGWRPLRAEEAATDQGPTYYWEGSGPGAV